MMWPPRKRFTPGTEATSSNHQNAVETAWKIHQAQGDWTNRVDAKAAFAFTIESAALATAVTLTSGDNLFSTLTNPCALVLFLLGIGLLILGAVLAALVVIPRLREKDSADEASDNFIYFGHARSWEENQLNAALLTHDILPQLSRQIVVMAKIAWVKHQRVKWSFISALVGILFLVLAGLIISLGTK